MNSLFEDITRSDAQPARETESAYEFLNRHPSPVFQQVRNLLADWFGRLPPQEQDAWRKSFQSRDDRVSQAAFWELYLHEVFRRMGCAVEIHPDVPKSSKKPDFLVHCGDAEFYVEATLMGITDSELAEQRRRDRLYETLQGTHTPDFFLMIDMDFEEGPGDPPGRRIRDRLEHWISEHEWEGLRATYDRAGIDAMPARSFEGAGWRIPIRLLPKPADRRGDPEVRPVGVYGPIKTTSDPIEDLHRPLREKASRYGVLPCPYLIAVVDPISSVLDYEDTNSALYGRTVERFARDADGQPVSFGIHRKADGFWQGPPEAQNTRVTGVVLAPNVRPESVAALEPELWVNPWASHPLEVDLPWQIHEFDPKLDVMRQRAAIRSSAELFGLAGDWPGPERSFE